MISTTQWRPVALAAFLGATMATGAAAQTVVVRGIPPGSGAELIQNGAVSATAAANAAGDATLAGNLTATGETRVSIHVDVCEGVRRVVIVERDAQAPAPEAGCTRTPIAGLFIIQPISTIVVNLAGPNPTVLLRQGPFDLRAVHIGVTPPAGLVVFGSGAFSRLHNAELFACGDIGECPGEDSGLAFGGGIGYWLTPYAGIEASYFKPKATLFEGAFGNSLFRSTLEPHVLSFVAKLGVPAGRVRLYGQGGATYHRATISNIQDSVDGIEDRFDLRTGGWGWTFGGGIELWVAPTAALYVEGGRSALKGSGLETGGEGSLDERMTFAMAGLRVSLSR